MALGALVGCASHLPKPAAQPIEVLHAFSGADGAWPRGSLVRDGTTLFGTTSVGGDFDAGTVFRLETDGSGFASLTSFTAGGDNRVGNQPHHNALVRRGDALIGAALYGGRARGADEDAGNEPETGGGPPPVDAAGMGTLFRIGTDGTDYTVLWEFGGDPFAAALPHSSPVLGPDGRTLYGTTGAGGASGAGTLYALGVDGTGFDLLHSFTRETGAEPHGTVSFDRQGNLLGMTRKGGSPPSGEGAGVVFRYDLAARRYEVLHTFVKDDPSNGDKNGHGFLTLVDGLAYATTEHGGSHLRGTLFRIGEDGSGFTILHSFAGAPRDGAKPYGSLVLHDGWLYGTTTKGGGDDVGTLFRYRIADGRYEVLASFDRAGSGAFPEDNVVFDEQGRTLYGLTQAGGANDPDATEYFGTVFALHLPDDGRRTRAVIARLR